MNNLTSKKLSLKSLFIALICALFLIPVLLISNLVAERQGRNMEAVKEVAEKWGEKQYIGGPYISQGVLSTDGKSVNFAHFLPGSLSIDAKVKTENRKRGIYTVPLYKTDILIKGQFDTGLLAKLNINPKDLHQKANVNLHIADLKGLSSGVNVKIGEKIYEFASGLSNQQLFNSGIHLTEDIGTIEGKTFEISFSLNGSQTLGFVPLGKNNDFRMSGDWGNPSFSGGFLPQSHKVDVNKFTAQWNILDLNRPFAQQGFDNFINFNTEGNHYYRGVVDFSEPAYCNVKFFDPVTGYVKALRANNYAFFLLLVVFVALFLAEFITKVNIHILQYVVIGAAIVLFYLILLAFSEHIGFNSAYLAGVIMVIAPVFVYLKAIINAKVASLISCITAFLFGMFFVMLISQDYSLLIGSLVAFVVLLGVMFVTKNFGKTTEIEQG